MDDKMPRRDFEIIRRQRGFSLLELSIVLVVIAVIVSISTVGINLYRSAKGIKAYTDFIQPWVSSYTSYVTAVKAQPGDDPGNPLGRVVGPDGGPVLCDSQATASLSNSMLSKGVSLPQGRGPGNATKYVYEDRNGFPHEMQVCFATVNWSVPGASVGTYVIVQKNVLDIRGLTPDLALQFDSIIDPTVTGNMGSLRDATLAADTNGAVLPWSLAPNATYDGHSGEGQAAELEAYLLLN
ncbi:prepilin-type N-terminal cleavage/methylation domain-containing protein [Burkholderia contaminans]|uniref:prepilin-type N-terminal cleavage/methylation domain-containing protein n=1 Tax=Burkholderia contaminans TaxID=488447 RepID=UPI002417A2A6|nr:prepilin-type N-terminal cleavage/methylation domain-containing protein [Burkholderia contaminans]WFN14908.1 prepilin-type N-terminal cleavage/methylation domain-containing protein [Burkholderia contaminans]